MSKNSVILNSELNKFARKYFIKDVYLSEQETLSFPKKYAELGASVFEQLLFFDKVSFKVYGENIPLVLLINFFGLGNLEKLIEQNAIEFLLWTPIITYNVDDLQGIVPIQSGLASTMVHVDPNESVSAGFKWLNKAPSQKTLKELQKKVVNVYKIPEKNVAANAASIAVDAYKSGKLNHFGMSNDVDITTLQQNDRRKLASLAQDVLETAILSKYKYNSYEKYNEFVLGTTTFDRIGKAGLLHSNASQLLEIENLPDLKLLFQNHNFDIGSLIDNRNSKTASRFREWLYNNSKSTDAISITQEYVNSIANDKGFFETKGGKFVKTLTMYAVGGGVGASLGGLHGSLFGTSLSKLLEPVADFGLDLIDTYFIEGLTKGWTPRMYLESMKIQIDKQKKKSE